MKKVIFIALVFSLFIFSCGSSADIKILGTWKCVECGENIADYSYIFKGLDECEMIGEGVHYYGKWEDDIGDMESLKISFDNYTFDRYYIKKLTSSKLILEKDGETFEYEKVK